MRTIPLKRTAAAVAGAVVLVGAGIGVVNAQQAPAPNTPTTGQNARSQFPAALAHRLNISTAQLQQALAGARQDLGLPATPPNGGAGGVGFFGRRPAMHLRGALMPVATLFGETPQQLRAELPGNSLADLAAKHNHTANDVVSALTNAASQRIDQAVSAGHLTSDRANQLKSNLSQRINRIVNFKFPTTFGQGQHHPNQPGASTP